MNTNMLTEPIAGMSPRLKARIAGLLYVLHGQGFSFAENTVRGSMVVWNDAAATAHNIMTHEKLYRLAFAAELFPLYIIVTFILYDLLKPVNKRLSLLAAVFGYVGCAFQALTCLFHLAPLVILGGSHPSTAFTPDQLQELALMSLKMGAQCLHVCMVFLAIFYILTGYLIFRSMFLPRVIGVLLACAGLAYMINSFANLLSLPLANYSFRYIGAPAAILGEGSLMLWLLIVGVNVQRWNKQASAVGACQ